MVGHVKVYRLLISETLTILRGYNITDGIALVFNE